MTTSHIKHRNTAFIKRLFVGATFLFIAQFSFQIFSFFSLIGGKQGLISARFLLLQGMQTWPVIRAMFYYLLVYFLLLIVISTIALLASRFLVIRLKVQESIGKVSILLLLLLYGSLMVTNTFQYPQTIARLLMASDWQAANNNIPYFISVAFLLIIFCISCFEAIIASAQNWRLFSSTGRRLAVGFVLVLVSFFVYHQNLPNFAHAGHTEHQEQQNPNIILIGLDSVRMDVIRNERLRQQFLPHLAMHLDDQNTAWFTNAFTPIARTFSAWYALLSGNEPKSSGVRYNLQQLTEEQKRSTIVPLLAEHGYHTMYGSDEKRFSTIDESYGFHETFGPPPGAAEWIMSILEDTPIHNMVRGTRFTRILLPYTSANRASATVYMPENFVKEVEYQLSTYDYSQPLFLSIHLCLSHWPYTWAVGGTVEPRSRVSDYFKSLEALDTQFAGIMAVLARSGLLKNSVVVVFTDHGEGLASSASMKDDPGIAELRGLLPNAKDMEIGHGTDLLTISQNQILLSVRDYSNTSGILPGKHDTLASLLDIAPTLARISGLPNYRSDGIDLSLVADGAPTNRLIFMETGFNLAALHGTDLDIDMIVQQGAAAYEISETGLLQVKQEYHDRIISGKQKGVTDGRYIVANDIQSSVHDKSQLKYLGVDFKNPESKPLTEEYWTKELVQLKERLVKYYNDEL